MTRFRPRTVPIASPLSCASLLCALAAGAGAHEYRVGEIEIDHPVAPAPPPGAPSVAGYLTLVNRGDTDDRLLGATADFAAGAEMHATTLDGDVARMRSLAAGIEVPAGTTTRLLPGGTHLMFVGPVIDIAVGDTLPVTLRFERAGEVEVVFNVEDGIDGGAPGGKPASAADIDHSGHDGSMPARDAAGAGALTGGAHDGH